ncbi:MAG: hypothetical protein MHMPM18_004035, partial [Marteilia pararefringens]
GDASECVTDKIAQMSVTEVSRFYSRTNARIFLNKTYLDLLGETEYSNSIGARIARLTATIRANKEHIRAGKGHRDKFNINLLHNRINKRYALLRMVEANDRDMLNKITSKLNLTFKPERHQKKIRDKIELARIQSEGDMKEAMKDKLEDFCQKLIEETKEYMESRDWRFEQIFEEFKALKIQPKNSEIDEKLSKYFDDLKIYFERKEK